MKKSITNSQSFILRLTKFVHFLESEAGQKGLSEIRIREATFVILEELGEQTLLYHYSAIRLLPVVFKEFFQDETGEVYFEAEEEVLDHISGSFDFFGLEEPEMWSALFQIDATKFHEKYGTKPLTYESTAMDIASNFRCIVAYKLNNLHRA